MPSFGILKKAFYNASECRFRKRTENYIFLSEIRISIKETFNFIIRALHEAFVNIYYGMPNKARKINRKIKEKLESTGMDIESINFFSIILETLKTKPVLHGEIESIDKILKKGNPMLLIANHPYVPIDGFTIMSMVHQYRSDYSFIINSNNFMHSLYPQFSHHFIPVKMTGGSLGTRDTMLAQRMSIRALKNCHDCLDRGGCLIIFPAGQGSKVKKWGEEIKDPEWLNGVGHIVKHFANNNKPLTILPIFIAGHMGGG